MIQMFNDPDIHVKEAAGEACGYFAENIKPDFFDRHSEIVPVLLK